MNSGLKSVCEKLDSIALQYLEEADALTALKRELGNEFAKGFLDLGHAKYTMGASKLSRYSYDERMKSLFEVYVFVKSFFYHENIISDSMLLSALDSNINASHKEEDTVYSISNVVFNDEEREKDTEYDEKQISEELDKLSLRQRAKNDTDNDAHCSNPKESDGGNTDQITEKDPSTKPLTKSTKKKKVIDRDPLHWFGLLVSPSLRTSQQHFKSVISRCIQQANHEHKLAKLETQYLVLREEKLEIIQEIERSAKALKTDGAQVDDREHDGEIHDELEDSEIIEDQVVPQ